MGKWHTATIAPVAGRPPAGPGRLRYYCVLMSHPFEGAAGAAGRHYKKGTYMVVTHNPLETLRVHNNREVNVKETRAVAPYWRLQFVTELHALESAHAFGEEWAKGTRGCASKKRRGMALARRYGVRCYSDDARPAGGVSTGSYLRAHAPRGYMTTYKRMRRA